MPDFSETETVMILKFHHALADGISTMAITSTFSDEGYNSANFPKLTPRMSFLKVLQYHILKTLFLPYAILVAQFAVLKKGKPNEVHPANSELKGKRKAAFSKSMDISVLRDQLKKKQTSLNNYIIVCA